MIVDLVQIRRLGEKARPENDKLRQYIRKHNIPDRRLRRIAEDVEGEIDCRACANCCRVATTRLLERDIEKLARFLRISISEFRREYTEKTEDEGVILRRTSEGCVFLSGNECTVYEARPATCEHFPHLVRGAGSLASRMWQLIDRACYCPIVYNTLEAYKETLGLRR